MCCQTILKAEGQFHEMFDSFWKFNCVRMKKGQIILWPLQLLPQFHFVPSTIELLILHLNSLIGFYIVQNQTFHMFFTKNIQIYRKICISNIYNWSNVKLISIVEGVLWKHDKWGGNEKLITIVGSALWETWQLNRDMRQLRGSKCNLSIKKIRMKLHVSCPSKSAFFCPLVFLIFWVNSTFSS